MVAVVLPNAGPEPIWLVILASSGVKLDVAVVVIPGDDCVDRFAPNDVFVPKDRFDFEPV